MAAAMFSSSLFPTTHLNKPLTSQFRPLSFRPSFSRIRASLLQDKEDKVILQDSFPSKTTSPSDSATGSNSSNDSVSSPSAWEKGVIKVEQSFNIFLTDSVIKILDALYHDRNYARFFVLETIARVPYFAFMSILHMYESFGWWRRADYLKVHFAESWNEMHHLLIMEELGGNAWWFDRFLAQHIAIFYYFMTALMYAISPRMAYHFSECVENHAFETYDKFIKEQGEELKKMSAPEVAVNYYMGDDLYLFDEFQTSRVPNTRRPKIGITYGDECEHPKPHPEPYLKGLEALKASKDHTFVFEDSVSGIKAGVAAGMPVIGLSTRNPEHLLMGAKPTFLIKDYDDPKLWAALEELDKSGSH